MRSRVTSTIDALTRHRRRSPGRRPVVAVGRAGLGAAARRSGRSPVGPLVGAAARRSGRRVLATAAARAAWARRLAGAASCRWTPGRSAAGGRPSVV